VPQGGSCDSASLPFLLFLTAETPDAFLIFWKDRQTPLPTPNLAPG
jgi:hypothetical protein